MASAGNGLLFPMFSLLLSRIITVFYEPPEKLGGDANFWAGMFVVGLPFWFEHMFVPRFAAVGLINKARLCFPSR